jgi:hypothetical protein
MTTTPQTIKDDIANYEEKHHVQLMISKNNNDYKCYFCERTINSNEWTGVTIGRYEEERNIEYLACGEKCCAAPADISHDCPKCGDSILVGYFKGATPKIECFDCTISHGHDSEEEEIDY